MILGEFRFEKAGEGLSKEYLTVSELAQLIGRTPAAIRNLVLRKRIPYRKPAGRLLFLADEIYRWVDEAEGVRPENINGR